LVLALWMLMTVAAAPELVEVRLVPMRIHGMPETAVHVCGQRGLPCQALHGTLFPDRVVTFDQLKDSRKSTKNPPLTQPSSPSGFS
jgi:hypothetical protein